MRIFCGVAKRKVSPELSLPEQLDRAWITCNNQMIVTKNRTDAIKFLCEKFHISHAQPEHSILAKLTILMALKKKNPDKNYIPSINDLPNDVDPKTCELMDVIQGRCKQYIGSIRKHGFGCADLEMETFVSSKLSEVREIQLLEKAFVLMLELINIHYGIRMDPISKRMRDAMNTELEQPQQPKEHEDDEDYDLERDLIHTKYAEQLSHITVQQRANNYKKTQCELMDVIQGRCKQYIGSIRKHGFGCADLEMETFVSSKLSEVREIQLLEKAFVLMLELINIHYGIRMDPISKRMRDAMNTELEQLQQPREHEDDENYDLERDLICTKYAEQLSHITVQQRANNYKKTQDDVVAFYTPMP